MPGYCESFEVVRCSVIHCFRDERKHFLKAFSEEVSGCVLVFDRAIEVIHEFVCEGFKGEGVFDTF